TRFSRDWSSDVCSSDLNEAAKQQVVVPSFHLLRAEPDGSLVVAGAAAPDAEVEILSGATVLATTKAGPTGDFAAILDKPLKPGEHDIVLRATAPDNVVATSMETAIEIGRASCRDSASVSLDAVRATRK